MTVTALLRNLKVTEYEAKVFIVKTWQLHRSSSALNSRPYNMEKPVTQRDERWSGPALKNGMSSFKTKKD
ncbi:MAG: hypothetical protein WBL02_06215 [Methanomethylovorans sp.]|uniref:hypothetical protein n=1 Tax=Methanomethylovorans sp. TaxID=2758717 RepID=UPI000AA4CB80|nr:hypothetical protein [Methanomethylovorans sp.]